MAEAPKALKSAELQRYYDNLFEMHGTAGWANLLEDLQHMEQNYNRVDAVDEQNTLDFRRGQLNVVRWLLGHKELVEHAYGLILEEEGGVELEPTGGVAEVVESFQ